MYGKIAFVASCDGVNNRVDAYLEQVFCHPMQIRRYYRQFDY